MHNKISDFYGFNHKFLDQKPSNLKSSKSSRSSERRLNTASDNSRNPVSKPIEITILQANLSADKPKITIDHADTMAYPDSKQGKNSS